MKVVMTAGESSEISGSRVTRDRFFFYLGIALIALGGPFLSLGSFAHDMYRIPVVGEAFGVFGWLNITFLVAGLLVLALGVALVALSLRGGVLPDITHSEEPS
ncbi:MAG: hypothetical protein ACE5IJ_02980 [Thermoplasmata archaeon]